MDEVGEVNNANQNNVGKIKKKHKKDRKSEKNAEGVEEERNVDMTKPAEKECISEEKRDRERDREKENKKKKKKNKGGEDAEAGMENGLREGELGLVLGDNGSAPTTVNGDRKMKKREQRKKQKLEVYEAEEVTGDGSVNSQDGGSFSGKEVEEKKKTKKKKNDSEDGELTGVHSENCEVNATEIRKKRKKDKKKSKDEQENVEDHAHSIEEDGIAKTNHERKKKKHKKKENNKDGTAAEQEKADTETKKKKKKKSKILKDGSDDKRDVEAEHANKGKSDGTPPTKSNKKVRFSDQDEVFPVPSNPNTDTGNDDDEDDLVIGKRFTREEDNLVKEAVLKYIAEYDLGEEGLKMIFNSSKHRKLKGCWRQIASVIPYRLYKAIYYRARIIFMRSESRKWTQEEYDMVRKYQETHGNQWRALADELGKHTWHVKDTWRRIKLPNLKKGRWLQEEYQKLFNLVNTDLQLKVSEEKRSKHGMLRDNISWSAISDTLSSRTQATCCLKWYRQMTSPMVAEGVWSDTDDYRLLSELYTLDATCMEDVDWDGLIEHRSGELCRKRWGQMVKHIGHYGSQSFAEQVEVLAHRYCPHLLEVREAWDNKPRVP